jgi:hypothetical protein
MRTLPDFSTQRLKTDDGLKAWGDDGALVVSVPLMHPVRERRGSATRERLLGSGWRAEGRFKMSDEYGLGLVGLCVVPDDEHPPQRPITAAALNRMPWGRFVAEAENALAMLTWLQSQSLDASDGPTAIEKPVRLRKPRLPRQDPRAIPDRQLAELAADYVRLAEEPPAGGVIAVLAAQEGRSPGAIQSRLDRAVDQKLLAGRRRGRGNAGGHLTKKAKQLLNLSVEEDR